MTLPDQEDLTDDELVALLVLSGVYDDKPAAREFVHMLRHGPAAVI